MTEDGLFAAVLEQTPADRSRFLEQACGTDPDLLSRLRVRLSAHENSTGIPDQSTKAPGSGEETGGFVATAEDLGTVIAGRYKLLEQIGEGGMGTVWVAEQTQPVRRLVALKLIKAGMDSKTVLARFEAERQALALMDHPNIAKVLDGGRTESGRPYFVMEYVKGVPFTTYCDDARLNVRERLALFVAVCQAVQHAHQKGIIHRDLKPSNILICLYDGQPVPKVIDFGLAKAMHQPLTEHTLYTAHGLMMGTPLYMSPEQAEFNNLDVDTRTDIYALGVILYELLTGTTPLEKQRFKEGAWTEMLRLIKEEEPVRPSARLSSSGSLPTVAAQRHVEPLKLVKLVRGELDWIVMKCLEIDRSRRYETANGLARDVQRYLADEVVEARPPSTAYRLRKLARRYRGSLVTAAGFAGLLVAAAAVSSLLAVRATRAEARAAAERDSAREARQRADRNFKTAKDAVENYLSKVTDNPNLTQADFHQLRKELLETALPFFQKLVEQESFDPDLRAARGEAFNRLGKLRDEMGERENAAADQRRAIDILEPLTAEFPAVPQYGQKLALSYDAYASVLQSLGQRAQAEDQYHKAIALQEQLITAFPTEPLYREDLGRSHNHLGILLELKSVDRSISYIGKRSDEAQAHFRKALDLREQLAADFPNVAKYHRDVGGTLNNLAGVIQNSGNRTEAVALYEQAIHHQELALARDPKDPKSQQFLCNHHRNLAMVFGELGRWSEAADQEGKGVGGLEQLVSDYPAVLVYRTGLGDDRMNLGILLQQLGRVDEAEAQHRKALELQKKLVAEFPSRADFYCAVGGSLDNLAEVMLRTGRPDQAIALFREAIQYGKEALERDPGDETARRFQASHHFGLGTVHAESGRRAEAEAHYRQAIEIMKKLAVVNPNDPEFQQYLASTEERLGLWLSAVGRWDGAAVELRAALAMRDTLVTRFPDNPGYLIDRAASHVSLGHLLSDSGRPPEAVDWYTKAIATLGPILAKEDRYVPARDALRDAHVGRARALDRLGRHAEAIKNWEQAVNLADGRQRAELQLGRAISQAYMSGNHSQALTESETLAKEADGPTLERLGRVCALASALGPQPSTTRSFHEEYAARAVALFRQAAAKGCRDVLYLTEGADLAPLRKRNDFQSLLMNNKGTGSVELGHPG
jgi:tetratricopeptide (TPR) repeat protein